MNKYIHAFLDHPVSLGLIISPFDLGIGTVNPLAFWLSGGTGITALALRFLTEHNPGVVRVLPYKLYMFVDFLVDLIFVAAPFALGLTGRDATYFWMLGITDVVVVLLDRLKDSSQTA